MATLVRIDAGTRPRLLVLDPPVSEEEFEVLCRDNRDLRLQRTKEGAVRMHPPTAGTTGSGNTEILRQLANWREIHDSGRVFDASTGFRLPDGATMSPDASFTKEERLLCLPRKALHALPSLCPDFVIELRSESDSMEDLKSTMGSWIANGARPGWLIDPWKRSVLVYRPEAEAETVTGETVIGDGPVEGFVLDLARVCKWYED